MLVLRSDQVDVLAEARRHMKRGVKRVLIQAPTGFGKTILTAHMLGQSAAKGMRAWFLVHRTELLEQSVDTFIDAADIHTGIIAAGFPSTPLAPVQVCAVQSLARRAAAYAEPDVIVFDECHHIVSETWSKIAAAFPNAFHIGLSATPQRLDRQGLKRFFDTLVIGPSTAQLIAAGFLSPYVLYAPTADGPNLAGVKTTAGDFNKSQLAKVLDGSTIVGDAVESYVTCCRAGTRALVFCWSIDASRKLAERFRDDGIRAEHLDGDTPTEARKGAMRAFRAGELDVICNVDLFGEGLDVPGVEAVFLLRPTQSLALYLQQVGRGLRPYPGKVAKIFDHAGNWARHGLPDAPRVWTLEDTPKKKKREPGGRRCLKCHAVSPPGATVCVACKEAFDKKPRQVKKVNGVLEQWRAMSHAAAPAPSAGLGVAEAALRKAEAARTLPEWRAIARMRGYKPGWAYHRFREQQTRNFMRRESI